jgi:hypothetical protein
MKEALVSDPRDFRSGLQQCRDAPLEHRVGAAGMTREIQARPERLTVEVALEWKEDGRLRLEFEAQRRSPRDMFIDARVPAQPHPEDSPRSVNRSEEDVYYRCSLAASAGASRARSIGAMCSSSPSDRTSVAHNNHNNNNLVLGE